MFTDVAIANYRPFSTFEMGALERVNLIAGSNDVGKTALLEALYLLIGEGNPGLLLKTHAFRGFGRFHGDPNAIAEWLWTPLFHDFATEHPITISGRYPDGTLGQLELTVVPRAAAHVPIDAQPTDAEITVAASDMAVGLASKALQVVWDGAGGGTRTYEMVVDQRGIVIEPPAAPPSLPGYFMASRATPTLEEDARNLGKLLVKEQPYDLLAALQVVEPRLRRIETIAGVAGAVIYGDIGIGRLLPLGLLGDGLSRFASLVLEMATARHGVVLVDEIENGLHHSFMRQVWAAVAEAARIFDVQVVATTHSWECIVAAHEAFSATGVYDFRLHRLDRVDGGVTAVAYDQETLDTSVQLNLEVR